MKMLAALLIGFALCSTSFAADQESAAGVYRSEVGIYTITVALLTNGNYLARWDGDIGSNGSSSGSWVQTGKEVRITPKKEEGPLMKGYLTVLLVQEVHGRKALLRKEDVKDANNPFFYLYLQKKPDQTSEPTAPNGRGPS